MATWQPRFQTRLEVSEISLPAIRRELMEQGYVILRNFFDRDVVSFDPKESCANLKKEEKESGNKRVCACVCVCG
jgi:hypothetical protein